MIHETAVVAPGATIGADTCIWRFAHVRGGAVIGASCIIGQGVYIDFGVQIGDRCKIQNGALLYHGVTLENGAFIGPGAILANDKLPRAVNPDGALKGPEDWTISRTLIREGASVGANATILPGVTVGRWALVGAGAVVTRNVPDHTMVYGNPARRHGMVCACGGRLMPIPESERMLCSLCGRWVEVEVER